MFDRKEFFGITVTVLGTVIGAGFISGREILTFFYGYDILLSVSVFALLFCAVLLILFFDGGYVSSRWFAVAKPLVYAGDLILMAGMLSALDSVYSSVFPRLSAYPIASVSALVLSVFIVADGVNGLKSANLVLTPIIVLFTLAALSFSEKSAYTFSGEYSPVSLAEYVGLNVFTSSLLFAELGKSKYKRSLVFAAIVSSLLLAGIIFVIYSALLPVIDKVYLSDVPVYEVLSENAVFKISYFAIILFGIFTTLTSCHYPLYELVKTKRANFIPQTILCLLAFFISRLGFYKIVAYLYPIIGGVGFVYIFVTFFLRIVFRSSRRKNTSARQGYKV